MDENQGKTAPPEAPQQGGNPPPAPLVLGEAAPDASAPAAVAEAATQKRTVWIYINREKFPVHLPDPKDPSGGLVEFPPVPDKATRLKPGMYQTHPWYDKFKNVKRSVTKEPAPDYLDLEDSIEPSASMHDLMKMNPDQIKTFLGFWAEQNPQMAQELIAGMRQGAPGQQ